MTDMQWGHWRRIYSGARVGRRINAVGDRAEALFWRLLLVADDYGNLLADPVLVRAEAAPRRAWTVEDVAADLDDLVRVGLLARYESGGEQYLHIMEFVQRQPPGRDGRRVRRYAPWPGEDQEQAGADWSWDRKHTARTPVGSCESLLVPVGSCETLLTPASPQPQPQPQPEPQPTAAISDVAQEGGAAADGGGGNVADNGNIKQALVRYGVRHVGVIEELASIRGLTVATIDKLAAKARSGRAADPAALLVGMIRSGDWLADAVEAQRRRDATARDAERRRGERERERAGADKLAAAVERVRAMTDQDRAALVKVARAMGVRGTGPLALAVALMEREKQAAGAAT